jgi:hypothetical protein
MTTNRNEWQEMFQAAVLEVDRVQLREKIAAAIAVIEQLRQELAVVSQARVEAQQLTDALMTLRLLERTELADSAASTRQLGRGSDGAAI